MFLLQFNKNQAGVYKPLDKPNVDTGMGVDRTVAILNGFKDNYLSPIWPANHKKHRISYEVLISR